MKKIVLLVLLMICASFDAFSMQLFELRPFGGEISLHAGYPYYSTNIMENQFLNRVNSSDDKFYLKYTESFTRGAYYQIESLFRLTSSLTAFGIKGTYAYAILDVIREKASYNALGRYKANNFTSCEQYGAFIEYYVYNLGSKNYYFLYGGLGYQRNYQRFTETYSPRNASRIINQTSSIENSFYIEPGVKAYYWFSPQFGIGLNATYSINTNKNSILSWNGPRIGGFIFCSVYDRIKDVSYDCEQ